VHISELSYEKRVANAEEVVRPGDHVRALVKDIDYKNRRISLSIRDAGGDPWIDFRNNFSAGQTITGTLEKRESFGLFIKLSPGVIGLLPQSKINQSPDRSPLKN